MVQRVQKVLQISCSYCS